MNAIANSTNTPPEDMNKPKSNAKKRIMIQGRAGLSLVVVALVIITSILAAAHHNNSKTTPIKPYYYHSLTAYDLKGTQLNRGISFSKPPELRSLGYKLPKDSQPSKLFSQAFLDHYELTKPRATWQSRITAFSFNLAKAPTSNFLKSLSKSLSKPKDPLYSSHVYPVSSFASNQDFTYDFHLSTAKPFSSTNIHKNAWIFNLTASPKTAADKAAFGDRKGEVLYAYGKHGFYYLLIEATDVTWQANQNIWQQVLNSVKIDQ